jgi:hypothetical protein
LTEEQKTLVRDNAGLVGVHLRRYVRAIAPGRCGREWQDLFQEGCLGLIRAAVAFREERGIPFAAYALPRIHQAVSEALRRAGDDPRGRGWDPRAMAVRRRQPDPYLTCATAEERAAARRGKGDAGDAPDAPPADTIGDRLRGKYERAVELAAKTALRRARRNDRDQLVRVVVEERLMIPQEESRRALRQIARDTRSSVDRVTQCERRLAGVVRGLLEADPEYRELRSVARRHETGCEAPIGDELERRLAGATAAEFVRRFRDADGAGRALMLRELLAASASEWERLIGDRVAELPAESRERLLGGAACV